MIKLWKRRKKSSCAGNLTILGTDNFHLATGLNVYWLLLSILWKIIFPRKYEVPIATYEEEFWEDKPYYNLTQAFCVLQLLLNKITISMTVSKVAYLCKFMYDDICLFEKLNVCFFIFMMAVCSKLNYCNVSWCLLVMSLYLWAAL